MMIMRVRANCHYSTTVDDHDIHGRSTTIASLTRPMTLATHGQVGTAVLTNTTTNRTWLLSLGVNEHYKDRKRRGNGIDVMSR